MKILRVGPNDLTFPHVASAGRVRYDYRDTLAKGLAINADRYNPMEQVATDGRWRIAAAVGTGANKAQPRTRPMMFDRLVGPPKLNLPGADA